MHKQETVIATLGITHRFGPVTAVRDLSITVPRGSVYAFLGPNGAGKTTTIRIMLGLIRPHAGQALLFGEPVRRAALARIGAMIEEPSLYPHLTGWENLEVTRRLVGATSRRSAEV